MKIFILFALTFIPSTESGNILILPSIVSASHKMGMVPLADALAERGHYVFYWAAVAAEDHYLPKKAAWKQPQGYVNSKWLNETYVYKNESQLFTFPWRLNFNIPGAESLFSYMTLPFCEDILKRLKQEITADILTKKWDLVIVDELFNPCGYLLTKLTGAPVIKYVSTSCFLGHSSYRNAQPSPRSYVPHCATLNGYSDRMTFLQRVHNTYVAYAGYLVDQITYFLTTRRIRVFYPEITDLPEALTKPDMLFFYFQSQVDFARPLMPNVAHVGGMHVRGALKPIPDDLLKAIDNGKKGFVLIATGHWARFEYASEETQKAFVDAFNQVASEGYTVIWQYEGDAKHKFADGVYRVGWLPQKELLAHPKCKAFLSHCGCNSALEAIINGVAVLGLGLFADQVNGATLLEAKGVGIRLDKMRLTKEIIYDTVIRVVTNESIQAKAKLFASIVANEPTKPIDRAVFWSEYLMRHKGGQWMRSRLPAGFGLQNTIKYYCLDVIAVMLGILSVLLFIIVKIVAFFARLVIK